MSVPKWAEGLARWHPHVDGDFVYDLSHLYPFRYALNLAATPSWPAEAVEIRVHFSSHTFTVGCRDGEAPDLLYSRPHDTRRFCLERYELSKLLPELMRTLEKRKCFFTNYENFFIVENPPGLAVGLEYWIFIDVRNVGGCNAVSVYVQSAYVGDSRNRGAPYGIKREKVGFKVLVRKALQNQRPRRPP